MSVFQIDGPLNEFRGRLPKLTVWPAAFVTLVMPVVVENASGFMKNPGRTFANGSPTCEGRTRLQLQMTLKGKPDRAVWMTFTCHPLKTRSDPVPEFK